GYLGPAATVPEHQGKGLATALTAQAMNFLGEQGFEQVCLYISERNQPPLRIVGTLGLYVGHEWKILTKSTTK
ncbi:MAG: GNAT family N-acetyltransferase, partial [Candidatus Methanomethyliaceae archaeon]